MRETLQMGHERLAQGGRLVASIDYARDQWLHEQLRRMFAKVTRRQSDSGVVYLATKTDPLRKLKNYAAEFAFRDGERLIQLRTRPGVFSHRELDGGARALIKTMRIEAGMRVLDLGCGSGAVGIAAAVREPGATVDAIDSSASGGGGHRLGERAEQCGKPAGRARLRWQHCPLGRVRPGARQSAVLFGLSHCGAVPQELPRGRSRTEACSCS